MSLRRWMTLSAAAVAAAGGVVLGLGLTASHYTPPSLPVKAPSAAPSPSPAVVLPKVASPVAYSVPVSVTIPSIGVTNAAITPEGCTPGPSGCSLNVPPLTGTLAQVGAVGWWDGAQGAGEGNFTQGDGTTPGQDGPAVLAAHINTAAAGNLTFADLDDMQIGDTAIVTLTDGVKVTFVAYATQEPLKTAFPTDSVYGMTVGPELRLITCGGAFDSATGHYLSNFIVYLREVT